LQRGGEDNITRNNIEEGGSNNLNARKGEAELFEGALLAEDFSSESDQNSD
jgi:hypothetical protein